MASAKRPTRKTSPGRAPPPADPPVPEPKPLVSLANPPLPEGRQAERRRRPLDESGPDFVFRYRPGPRGGYEYVSPAAVAVTGYGPEEFYADPELGEKLVHPQDRALVQLFRDRPETPNGPILVRLVRKDGAIVWTEQRTTPVFDDSGAFIAIEGVIADVAAHPRPDAEPSRGKKAGADRPTRAEDLSAAFETAADAIIVMDSDHIVRFANAAAHEIFGQEGNALLGRPVTSLMPSSMRRTYLEGLPRVAKPGGREKPSRKIELTGLRKDATQFPIEISLSVWRSGRATYYTGIVRDIRRRHEQGRVIDEQNRFQEGILRGIEELGQGVSIYVLNTGRFVYANDALCRMFGYTREELLKLAGPIDLAAPEERERMADRLRRRADGMAVSEQVEFTGRRKDGTRLTIEASVKVIPGAGQAVSILRDISERKRATAVVGQLAALVESADDAILGVGLEGFITSWNPAAERIYGLRADEVLGRPLSSLTTHERADETRRALQKAINGDSAHVETMGRRKDGDLFPISLTVSPVRDAAGLITAVSVIGRDETARQLGEERLQQTLSLYSATLESTADGILVEDLEGHVRSFNRRFVDLWNVPGPLLTARDSAQVLAFTLSPLREPEAARRRIAQLQDKPEAETYDLLEFRDGRVYERFSQPQRVGDQVVGRVWSFRDVSEKRRADEALRLTREVALAVAEAANVADALRAALEQVCQAAGYDLGQAWTVGPDRKRLDLASAFHATDAALATFHEASKSFHLAIGEGLPGSVWSTKAARWLPDTANAENFLRSDAAKKAGLVAGLAVPVLAKDEVVAVLEFFVRERRDEDAKLAGLVSTVAAQLGSLVLKKRAEDALRTKTDELARMNQELEQFVYFASHDLREPLHVVLGYLQRLERRYRGTEAEFEPMWDFAVKGALRMQDLIKDLLSYARLGRDALRVERVDLGKLYDTAVETLKWDIDESGATLTHDKLPKIDADPKLISQVLQNLLSNAIKFRGAKPAKIHFGAQHEGHLWHFSVKDNGIGIPPENAERIFVIFQRLHTQDEYPGTGIGLSICKKIIEHHGGRIWVESKEGKGSTFHFTVPDRRGAA